MSEIMKPIILISSILALVAVVTAKPNAVIPEIEQYRSIQDECQADPATRVDNETIEKFFEGESIDEVKFGKFILCMNIKVRVQNENGDIDKEALKKEMKKVAGENNEMVQKIVDECGEKKGNTALDAALALAKCYRKHRPAFIHEIEHKHGQEQHHQIEK